MESLRRFDYKITLAVQSWPGWWRPIMAGVSFLGEPIVALAIGFSGFVSAAARDQTEVQRAFVYATVAFALSTLLKLSLRRRRPLGLDVRTLGVRSYSFPSGHAFGTVIFYGLFSYLDFKYLSHPWNITIAILIWPLVILIGLSRVYLKFHYPSDVAAGWLLGLISLVAVIELAF
jgi:membrane-associated phospholipid phosphatase